MYAWLMLLLVLNISLLAWNMLLAPDPGLVNELPATVENVPELIMVDKIDASGLYSSALAPANSSCFSIGPYNTHRAANQVLGKIHNYGLSGSLRSIKSTETLNFLVYIPAYPNREEAEKVAQAIAKHDVDNLFIIQEGPYRNAISLGFFDDVKQAMRHAEFIRYLGYDARYTEQQASREVYWLDYDEPLGSHTPVMEWSRAIDPSEQVQKIPRACVSS